MSDHKPDPHHTSTGEWVCWHGWTRDGPRKVCGRPLAGSYLRPVIPWRHKDESTERLSGSASAPLTP